MELLGQFESDSEFFLNKYIMAVRKQLLDQDNNQIYPITDTESVRNPQGEGTLESRIQSINEKANSSIQPLEVGLYTEDNFVAFNENGGIKDSGCNEDTFIKGVKQNGTLITPDNGIVDVTVEKGKSAYDLYVESVPQGETPMTEEEWLASLKAQIGGFKFITPTDTMAEAALTTIGSTYVGAIGSLSPSQSTLSIILLMNDSNNTKTMMIATQDDGSSGFEFVYAGDLQSAMPSNVLTETYIDDTHLVNPTENSLAKANDISDISKMYGDKVFNITEICQFVKNGIINSSGNYINNTAGKIYRLSLKAGDNAVIYLSSCSVNYAALSKSPDVNPSSFTLHLMGYGTSQQGYYSYTAVNDINLFIELETGATGIVRVKRENGFDSFGFKNYTYGENAVKDYVGTNTSDTTIWGSGFLTSNGSITSDNNYHYTKNYILVYPGEYIQAGMVLAGNARICFYKEDKSFLSAISAGHATESRIRTVPQDAYYMRFCMSNTDTDRLSWIYQNEGTRLFDNPDINSIKSEVMTLQQSLATIDKSIDNNLLNESNKIDGWSVKTSTDGTNYTTDNSLYGQPNIRYQIPVDNSSKVLHVKFRFKFTQPLAETSGSTNHNLLIVGTSDSYRAALRQTAFSYNSDSAILQRRQFFVVQQNNNVSDITLDNALFKQFEGAIAYSLEYKSTSYSSAVNYKLQLSSTAINVYDSDSTTVLETISIDTDELVSSVVDKVNNTSSYLKAVPYEVDGTKYTDCLNGSVKFPLCVSSTGSRPWMISKKLDEKWHTFECVLDYNTLKSYTGIDGTTVVRAITEPTSKTLYIGGAVNFSAYKMVPVLFRDLHIGYGYEDAEVITYPNNVSGTLTRLISNESPYLMIFEGHGIENKMNKNMPTGSDTYMATSTDTLRTVFDALRSKGFVPISWQDIVRWKKYGGKLPKRCYTLMFDDWRIENYMNLDLRKPFVEYGVKPGLAVITSGEDGSGDTESRNTQITIDGKTWTVGECFDAIIKGGWYPCSHTKNHTVISNVKDMELFSLLKDCIYSCDKLGIYDDVIVYPTGSASSHKKLMMMVSGFAIGVQVAVNGFNSLASLDFNLIRNEIGSRKNINNILAQIV